jgi:hypothetical protein
MLNGLFEPGADQIDVPIGRLLSARRLLLERVEHVNRVRKLRDVDDTKRVAIVVTKQSL